MVKLYASILAVVLTTSLTLAVPLAIVSDELEARDPSFLGKVFNIGSTLIPGCAEVRAAEKAFEYGNKARKTIERMKQVHDAVSSNNNNNKKKKDKHHRRELEELSLRDLSENGEELLGREYDILDERDYLD